MIKIVPNKFKDNEIFYIKLFLSDIKKIFDRDIVVAGGFARKKAILELKIDQHPRYGGDIDFFLLGPKMSDEETSEVLKLFHKSFQTAERKWLKLGWLHNNYSHFLRRDIQFIQSEQKDPSSLLLNFDFVNCMIGFDQHNIYHHQEFKELERNKILKFDHVNNLFKVPLRTFKYLEHELSFDDAGKRVFNDSILDALPKLSETEVRIDTIYGVSYRPKMNTYLNLLMNVVDQIDNDSLIFIMQFVNSFSKERFNEEFQKRFCNKFDLL